MNISTATTTLIDFLAVQDATAPELGHLQYDVAPLGWTAAPTRPRSTLSDRVMTIRFAAGSVLVGPLDNGSGPCGLCLEHRWWTLRSLEEQRRILDWRAIERSETVEPQMPRLDSFGLDAIWALVCQVARSGSQTGSCPPGEGDLLLLDLQTHAVTRYGVAADSLCPRCGQVEDDSADAARLALRPVAKKHPDVYRQRTLEEFQLREDSYVNPLCGALGQHAVRDLYNSFTAPVSGQMQVGGTRAHRMMWWGGHTGSYRQSLSIGLIEGLERLAGLLPRVKTVRVFDSYRNLGADAIDPLACGSYEASTCAKPGSPFVPFTPDLKVHWVWGYSLTRDRPVLLPEQLVYYGDWQRGEPRFVWECSNGCATGSSLEEAILFGLLELIERDSFLITWFGQLALPQLDPWSCADREVLFVLDRLVRAGYDPYLFDMRLDLGIPAVLAAARRRTPGDGNLVFAAGCSLNPQHALRSAVFEICYHAASLAGRVDRQRAELEEMASDFTKVAGLEDHVLVFGLQQMSVHADFLWRHPARPTVPAAYEEWERTRPRHADLRADIDFCLDRLRRSGLHEVIVVDQTSREQARAGLTTACVTVPGLVPIDFGYDKRRYLSLPRTFTVPRRAGFRAADLQPGDLNVAPHPFP